MSAPSSLAPADELRGNGHGSDPHVVGGKDRSGPRVSKTPHAHAATSTRWLSSWSAILEGAQMKQWTMKDCPQPPQVIEYESAGWDLWFSSPIWTQRAQERSRGACSEHPPVRPFHEHPQGLASSPTPSSTVQYPKSPPMESWSAAMSSHRPQILMAKYLIGLSAMKPRIPKVTLPLPFGNATLGSRVGVEKVKGGSFQAALRFPQGRQGLRAERPCRGSLVLLLRIGKDHHHREHDEQDAKAEDVGPCRGGEGVVEWVEVDHAAS